MPAPSRTGGGADPDAGETAAQLGLPVLARLVGYQSHAALPAEFTSAPIGAIKGLLAKVGWRVEEVDCSRSTRRCHGQPAGDGWPASTP